MRTRPALVGTAAVTMLVLAGCAASSPAADRGAPPAAAHRAPTEVLGEQVTREQVIVSPYERQAFLEVAMQPAVLAGHRRVVLQRWERDPTFSVAGAPTPADLRHLDEAAAQWTLVTHRRLTPTSGRADVTVHFVPRARFATVLHVDAVDPTAVGLTRVSFAAGHRGTITGATVVIASDDDQVTRNRTIAHELGHAMGLQHSTCPSSLMDGASDGDRSVRWSPSALDVRLGGLLYDPVLAPGMDRPAVDARLSPTAPSGAACAPVDLELVRAAGSGEHYLCVRSPARLRACTSDTDTEPVLPLRDPDAWTDGASLRAAPDG